MVHGVWGLRQANAGKCPRAGRPEAVAKLILPLEARRLPHCPWSGMTCVRKADDAMRFSPFLHRMQCMKSDCEARDVDNLPAVRVARHLIRNPYANSNKCFDLRSFLFMCFFMTPAF